MSARKMQTIQRKGTLACYGRKFHSAESRSDLKLGHFILRFHCMNATPALGSGAEAGISGLVATSSCQ